MHWHLTAFFTPQFWTDFCFHEASCSQNSSCKPCIHPGAGKIGILFWGWIIRQWGMWKIPGKCQFLQGGFVMLTSTSLPEEAKPQGCSLTQDSHKAGCVHATDPFDQLMAFTYSWKYSSSGPGLKSQVPQSIMWSLTNSKKYEFAGQHGKRVVK